MIVTLTESMINVAAFNINLSLAYVSDVPQVEQLKF
jgi:hypothetical protein